MANAWTLARDYGHRQREQRGGTSLSAGARPASCVLRVALDGDVPRVRKTRGAIVDPGLPETGSVVTAARCAEDGKRCTAALDPRNSGVDPVTVHLAWAVVHDLNLSAIAERGPYRMQPGARTPTETRSSFPPRGYLLAGDLGTVGVMRHAPPIVGPHEETAGRASSGLYPRDVKDHLRTHPRADEHGVTGIPLKRFGKLARAYIAAAEDAFKTAAEIKGFARSATAHVETPDLVRFDDMFPSTGTGRLKLRELERTVSLEYTPLNL